MMKDPKKVAMGKRLAEWKIKKSWLRGLNLRRANPDYVMALHGAVIAVGVLGLLGYYIYQRGSPGDNNDIKATVVRSLETQENNLEME